MVGVNSKFEWGTKQQNAFDEMKRLIAKETLLTFPDFNEVFHIYTDASDFQLGAVIMQNNKPIAFYSRKMDKAQRRYTTGEQELLSIVETLKEFKNILLGQKLIVHTDHKNILYGKLSNDRITRWRLLLEEYGPEYVHVRGVDNVVADALSRMDADFEKEEPNDDDAQECAHMLSTMHYDESIDIPSGKNAEAMAECYANNNEGDFEYFSMSPILIAKEQQKDKKLLRALKTSSKEFGKMMLEDRELITYNKKLSSLRVLKVES